MAIGASITICTATSRVYVVAHQGETVLQSFAAEGRKQNSSFIAGAVAQCLDAAPSLDALGVVIGPGSWTGVRIALAFADAFTRSRAPNVDAVQIPTHDLLFAAAEDRELQRMTVFSGDHEAWSARYQSGARLGDPERVPDPSAATPEDATGVHLSARFERKSHAILIRRSGDWSALAEPFRPAHLARAHRLARDAGGAAARLDTRHRFAPQSPAIRPPASKPRAAS